MDNPSQWKINKNNYRGKFGINSITNFFSSSYSKSKSTKSSLRKIEENERFVDDRGIPIISFSFKTKEIPVPTLNRSQLKLVFIISIGLCVGIYSVLGALQYYNNLKYRDDVRKELDETYILLTAQMQSLREDVANKRLEDAEQKYNMINASRPVRVFNIYKNGNLVKVIRKE